MIGGTQAVAAWLVAGKTRAVVPELWPWWLSEVWLYARPAPVRPRRRHAAGAAVKRGRWRVEQRATPVSRHTPGGRGTHRGRRDTHGSRPIRAGRAPPSCARQASRSTTKRST